MTFSLVEVQDKHIIRSNNLAIRRPGLYPSEASVEYEIDGRKIVDGTCLRAAWYRSSGIAVPEPTKAGLMMKAHLGKAAEEMVVEDLKQMGLWVDNNIKFYNKEYAISGELDFVIREPETDRLIGIECKSYYGYNANKGITGSKRPPLAGKPKMDQFLQAVLYSYEYRDKLDEYRMFYIERGDGHRVEFAVGTTPREDGTNQCWWKQLPGPYWNMYIDKTFYQPFTIEDIYSRYKTLIKHLKEKRLPPKDYSNKWDNEKIEWMYSHNRLGKTKYNAWQKKNTPIGDWHCSYCKYKTQCNEDSLTE